MSGRKKILFLITKSNFGGAQRYVYDLATNLPREEYEAVVAYGGTGAKGTVVGTLDELLKKAGVRTVTLSRFARDIDIVNEFRTFFEVLALIHRERPNVLHVNSSKAGGLGALAGRIAGVPRIIFTAHGWPHQEERLFYQKLLIYLISWLTVLLSHATIVVSKRDLLTAPAAGKRASVQLIPNGIEDFPLLSRDDARNEIMQAVGKNIPNQPWIGSVSELTKNKGLDMLIRAVPYMGLPVNIVLIGTGEERGRLELLANKLGIHERLIFTGFIKDARHLLKAFDIYVMPSRKEGLPYALLEAGLAGLPTVATNVGGIPDIIEDNVSGLLTHKNSPAEIGTAIESLLSRAHARVTFGKSLQSRVNKYFSFDTMLKNSLTLYNQ